MYRRDKEIIEKLEQHKHGHYKQFTVDDVEYLIATIKRCCDYEREDSTGGNI